MKNRLRFLDFRLKPYLLLWLSAIVAGIGIESIRLHASFAQTLPGQGLRAIFIILSALISVLLFTMTLCLWFRLMTWIFAPLFDRLLLFIKLSLPKPKQDPPSTGAP